MFPLADENPTFRTPIVTMGIIFAMFAVWVGVQAAGFDPDQMAKSICRLGMVPAELTHQRAVGFSIPLDERWLCTIDDSTINWFTPFISMFLHGGWGHIIGNALFLWVFGNNVEDVMGRQRFFYFYIICGLIAAGTQIAVDPRSPIPTVGASGAISGALGAYLLLYPTARVRTFFPPLFFFRLPAWLLLGWWFILQFWSGLPQLLAPSPEISGGVAVWAHVGGFAAGVLLSKAFEDPALVARHREFLRIGVREARQ